MCKVLKCKNYKQGSYVYCEKCQDALDKFDKPLPNPFDPDYYSEDGDEDDFWKPKAYSH